MKFSAIFIVFTFVLAGSASTPADVKADVTAIVGKVMNLDNVITQLPMKGATVDQFTAIQRSGQDLAVSLQKCTVDVKNLKSALSEADGNAILSSVKTSAPFIEHSLNTFIEKQAAFAAVGLSSDAKEGLVHLNTHSDSFGTALIEKAPVDLKGVARELKQKLDADFSKAIAAF
ncbi:hypothetical protein L208DRAFT_672132 [Tricholoma matsutake]|nr:hypothetical protein L208DRAFT_672132 [Tricholoma matsutake 945]